MSNEQCWKQVRCQGDEGHTGLHTYPGQPIPEAVLTPEQERVSCACPACAEKYRQAGIREVMAFVGDECVRADTIEAHFFPKPQTREERMEALLVELLHGAALSFYADTKDRIREVLGGGE